MTAVSSSAAVTEIVDSWFAALNEPDPAQRAAYIERAWVDHGHWVDPPFEGQGHATISEMIAGTQGQYPGTRFRRTTQIDVHHDVVRYGWELVGDDGTLIVTGLDVGQLAADGRLQRVSGFFGELAAEQAA
jgi:hypothetical protein